MVHSHIYDNMDRNIGVELNVAVGEINHVLPNIITANISSHAVFVIIAGILFHAWLMLHVFISNSPMQDVLVLVKE